MNIAIAFSCLVGLLLGGTIVLLVRRPRWLQQSAAVEAIRQEREEWRREAEATKATLAVQKERLDEVTAARAKLAFDLTTAGTAAAQALRAAQDAQHEVERRYAGLESTTEQRAAELAKREREVRELQERAATLSSELVSKAALEATLQAQLQEERRASADKLNLLHQSQEELEKQFTGIAAQVLESNTTKFETNTTKRLDELFGPMRERLTELQKKVDDTHLKDIEDRTALRSELKIISDTSRRLDEDAVNLTRALKGDSRTQGAWGEVVLDRVLERSGLREGTEYIRQASMMNEEQQRQRPDVVVNLPGSRHVVVDSKVSLTAYEMYCSATEVEEQQAAIEDHVESIRNHINNLADKKYWKLAGINTPDFVLMFVPIESALIDAGRHDHTLFEDALRLNVILATPITLVAMLRTIDHCWQVEYRNENSRAIVVQAGRLYDKLCGFVGDLQAIKNRLRQANEAYEHAETKLTGHGSVIRQAQKLLDMGAKPTKALPSELTGQEPEETDVLEPEELLESAPGLDHGLVEVPGPST